MLASGLTQPNVAKVRFLPIPINCRWGTLLNLAKDVHGEWEKDVSENIGKAESILPRIKDTPPSEF
jgi:hypothetical protein